MKRLTSLFQSAALAAALVVPGLANAQSRAINMYLVPLSSINGWFYYPGDTIQFAAVVDIPTFTPGDYLLTLGAAVTYDPAVFDINKITAAADTTAYPPKPSVPLWNLVPPFSYSQTTDGLSTFQLNVGHGKVTVQPGNTITTIPPGTYTIGTYSFPILASAPYGYTTISLPSASGKTGSNGAIDFIGNQNSLGNNNDTLTFPPLYSTGNGKYSQLTFSIGIGATFGGRIIAGTVNFEGLPSDVVAPTATVEFRPKAGGRSVVDTTYNGFYTGHYADDLPIQSYIVHISCGKYLAANVDSDQGTLVQDDPYSSYVLVLPPVTLRAGDANSDNTIDIADFGLLVAAYGATKSDPTSGYNPNVDFNNDGSVDISDFSLLVNNFGSTGDL